MQYRSTRAYGLWLFGLLAILFASTTAVFGQSSPQNGKQPISPTAPQPATLTEGGFIGVTARALILDGSFEENPTTWTEWADPVICPSSINNWEAATQIPSYDGSRYLWGGGLCNSIPASNYASKSLTIDPDQTILSFYYYTLRLDDDGEDVDDFGYVSLNGETVWQLSLTQQNNSAGWQNVQIPITSFSGTSAELRLGATSGDETGIGNIFYDHVELISTELTISATPEEQTIANDEDATFTISITNNGEVALDNVVVTATVADCASEHGTLAPDETASYSCTAEDVGASFTNVVTATGDGPQGVVATAEASADVNVSQPGLSLSITPDEQTVYSGETAVFNLTVTNTGNESLNDIVITSAEAPDCNSSYSTIPANDSRSYSCDRPGVLEGFTNLVEVTAFSALGEELTANNSAEVSVIAPQISISKTPDSQTVNAGETAVFDVTIHNEGDTVLTDLVAEDSAVNSCNRTRATLEPNQSFSYTCQAANVQSSFNSEISVMANDLLNNEVSASDTAFVEVNNLNLRIFVSPDEQTIVSGEEAEITILVLNLSSVTLQDVAVSVPQLTACSNPDLGLLAPEGSSGDSVSYSCSATVTDPLSLEATVTGNVGSTSVQNSNVAQVNVLALSAQLTSLVEAVDEPGEDVDFTLLVQNEGNRPLTLTEINSVLLGDLDNAAINGLISNNACVTGQELGAGESYSCTYTANISGQPGIYNTAVSVSASGEEQSSLSAATNAPVTIRNLPSSLFVSSIATPGTISAPQANVAYQVEVINESSVDAITINQISSSLVGVLSNVGSCSLPRTLAPQETYSCQYTTMVAGNADTSRVNALVVSGVDDDGDVIDAETAVSVQIVAPPVFHAFIPSVQHQTVYGEPNDSCNEAFQVGINRPFRFLPDDVQDWYFVDVPTSGPVTFSLANFTPRDGQMVIYRGESCGEAMLVGNDGSFETTKRVVLGNQQPGRYFIFIINDGVPSTTVNYSLTVQTN